MTWFEVILLVVSGILAGFVNTLAGGGSIISLSLFIFLGLPADVANGTNRIGVLLQTLTSVFTFGQKKVLDFRKGAWLGIPAVIGSIIGAQVAVDIDRNTFEKAIAIVLLLMIFFIVFKPSVWMGNAEKAAKKPGWLQLFFFFLIGVYGGFVQVGVGYFLLAALVLVAGFDLVKANALKVWIVLLYTPFALLVFIKNDQVDWAFGLTHAAGNIIGAYIASNMAIKKGAGFVKWVIIIVIILTSGHLLGLYDFTTLYLDMLK
jgi:uncharacterized protein